MSVNTEQAAALAGFLDTAGDYLAGGARRPHPPFVPAEETAPAPADAPDSGDTLPAIAREIAGCERCGLCRSRANTVPGEGAMRPLVMVIGEGPGREEDATGRPFVGRAGQLLDRMLDSRGQIGLSRAENCYIANILKCRATRLEDGVTRDRPPAPGEAAACLPFLLRQIRLLAPRVIVAMGNPATQTLLGTTEGITRLRGRFVDWAGPDGRAVPLLPTFHPSYLLRNESDKALAWEDLKLLRAKLRELDAGYAAKMNG